MAFKGILKDLVDRVHGAEGAILVDWEGEAVDQYAKISDYDIKFIGAHMGIILYNLGKRMKDELGDDNIREISINMESRRFVVTPVDKDYFAVLVLSGDAVLALVRHDVKMAVKAIKEEF